MRYALSYIGIAVNANDPKGLGRVQVRVPQVYGAQDDQTPFSSIPDADLPWAIPCALPGSKTADSGGISFVPDTGARLLVRFLDGEPEKPVWEYLMQTEDYRDIWAAFPQEKSSQVVPDPQTGSQGASVPQSNATLRRAKSAMSMDGTGVTTTSPGKSTIAVGNLPTTRKRAEQGKRIIADPDAGEAGLETSDHFGNFLGPEEVVGSADLFDGTSTLPLLPTGGGDRLRPPTVPVVEPDEPLPTR